MRTAIFGAAVLVAATCTTSLSAQESPDERLEALADAYYDYQLEQFGLTENASGSTEQGDRLWSVAPEAQRARAAQYAEYLAQLDKIDI